MNIQKELNEAHNKYSYYFKQSLWNSGKVWRDGKRRWNKVIILLQAKQSNIIFRPKIVVKPRYGYLRRT